MEQVDLILLRTKHLSFLLIIIALFINSCNQEAYSKQDTIEGDLDLFKFSPSKTVEIIGNSKIDKTISNQNFIVTNSHEELNLKWKLIDKKYPEGWSPYICDNVVCFVDIPDSNNLNPINYITPEKKRRIKMYLDHFGVKGEGFVSIEISSVTNPTLKDTLTYKMIVN